eukprot:TRINITY_DN3797_c0_g1_i1.p1 TRINITY_DN3797_c0_g1~~TRINITY_DN3797_c0_g1_i1.p1  ORF type:complete len:111 (+),score=18.42 TRINITY_DN3797_c0_g1_i1:270-602(+)
MQQLLHGGQGHESFVSAVSFQPEIRNKTYTFVSTGQDHQVVFWKYEDVPAVPRSSGKCELEVKDAQPRDETVDHPEINFDVPIEVEAPSRKKGSDAFTRRKLPCSRPSNF